MLRQKRVSPERDGKKPSKASKDSPEEVAMREKLAKARKRQEMEKAERRQQMEEERVRYPEDEEVWDMCHRWSLQPSLPLAHPPN